jgi:hypothetical protein
MIKMYFCNLKCHILLSRYRTCNYGAVPQFVIDALEAAPHDSQKYSFWTGEGRAHSRTNKWGERLQRLFVLAEVKVVEVEKKRRSSGKLKTQPQTVRVSLAKPHILLP